MESEDLLKCAKTKMKQITFKRKINYRGSVIILLALIYILLLVFAKLNLMSIDARAEEATKKSTKEQTISTLWGKAQENKAKVEAIDKIKNAKQISEAELKGAIDVLFKGDEKKMVAIANCENGSHVADRTNTNKDGSKDRGILQINDFWHSKRVERLFNMPFIKAIVDPARNLVYGAILHNKQGNTSAWACSKIVERNI